MREQIEREREKAVGPEKKRKGMREKMLSIPFNAFWS